MSLHMSLINTESIALKYTLITENWEKYVSYNKLL